MLPKPITKEQILEELKLSKILDDYQTKPEGLVWELNGNYNIDEATLAKVKHEENVNNGIVIRVYTAKFLFGGMCNVHASKPDDLIAELRTYGGYTLRCNLDNSPS